MHNRVPYAPYLKTIVPAGGMFAKRSLWRARDEMVTASHA